MSYGECGHIGGTRSVLLSSIWWFCDTRPMCPDIRRLDRGSVNVGGGPAPNYGQGYGSYLQALPLCLLLVQVGGAPGVYISRPGAQGEAPDCSAMGNRREW